jgi:hypothetical protein
MCNFRDKIETQHVHRTHFKMSEISVFQFVIVLVETIIGTDRLQGCFEKK